MKKTVWVFGLIIGAILCGNMFVMVNMLYNNPDMKTNDVLGYAAMVIMFSLIFFGGRNYRNKYLGGFISFGRALKTGVLIALVGCALYVVVWLFYYYLFVPDFLDKYTAHVLRHCTPGDLAEKTKEMENFRKMYQNPAFVALTTFAEVFPIGLIVALISAFLLKRKRKDTK